MYSKGRTLSIVALAILGLVSLPGPSLPVSRASSGVAPFRWINGKVDSFTFQLPRFNLAGIKEASTTEFARFCNPSTGVDYDLTTANVQYDLLKTAFQTGKSVEVGVNDFGPDPAAGTRKLCIDRVILR